MINEVFQQFHAQTRGRYVNEQQLLNQCVSFADREYLSIKGREVLEPSGDIDLWVDLLEKGLLKQAMKIEDAQILCYCCKQVFRTYIK